jgi:hypothetical protein
MLLADFIRDAIKGSLGAPTTKDPFRLMSFKKLLYELPFDISARVYYNLMIIAGPTSVVAKALNNTVVIQEDLVCNNIYCYMADDE